MNRTIRYLLRGSGGTAVALGIFTVVLVVCARLPVLPEGAAQLLRNYYASYPFILQIILYIVGFSAGGAQLRVALSFGSRRRDCFRGAQAAFLTWTLLCWALAAVFIYLPAGGLFAGRWSVADLMEFFGRAYFWLLPLTYFAAQVLGCVNALVFLRSRAWGTLMATGAFLLWMGALIAGFLAMELAEKSGAVGGAVLLLAAAAAAAVILSAELVFARAAERYVVR